MNVHADTRKMVQAVLQDELFQTWSRQHNTHYLTHLFCTLASDFSCKTPWEVGFYERENGKMTVFTFAENGSVAIKPADEVFKKENTIIEELAVSEIKLEFAEAARVFTEHAASSFAKEILGDGFVILQELGGKTVWNFTFVTHSLKFANVKINGYDGSIISQEIIEVVQQR